MATRLIPIDRRIRAKKGEQREFRDGALTYFAGRQFFFVDVLDEDSPSTTPERIVGPRLQNQEAEPQRTGSQANAT